MMPVLAAAHAALVMTLAPGQAAALATNYPEAQIVAACAGNFSGAGERETVLGIWTDRLHRVGLVLDGGKWQVHDIDLELRKDEPVSHSFPLAWEHKVDDGGFHGAMKCKVNLREEPDLSQGGKVLGRPPFFRLGAAQQANACFGTSNEYNNWDCVAFDPKQRRFRLWYQQVFAD
jgi:hypothetical protein